MSNRWCLICWVLLGSFPLAISDDLLSYNQPVDPQGRMHIVLVHFHPENLQHVADWWQEFIKLKQVAALRPAMYLYCKNPVLDFYQLLRVTKPMLKWGGQIERSENIGRENYDYLSHIIKFYDSLPDYILFSQAQPEEEAIMLHRMQNFVVGKRGKSTGFLPLALIWREQCFTDWLPLPALPQVYAILTKELCPPEGFAASMKGQFVVSRQRMLAVERETYTYMLGLLTANLTHWIHMHDRDPHLFSTDSPRFGHLLERIWSVAFNCHTRGKEDECNECDEKAASRKTVFSSCDIGKCQCLDDVATKQ